MTPLSIFKTAKKMLIVGGYGTKNYGDEAILAGIIETVRNANPCAEIEVVAGDPQEITRLHSVQGWKVTQLLPRIFSYNTILIGGGTIFRQHMRLRAQIVPVAALILKLLGKQTVFYSLGVDKNTSLLAKLFLVLAMNNASAVSVRDKDSLEVLKAWGVTRDIDIIPDPGLALQPAQVSDTQLKTLGIDTSKRRVGLSLRNLKKDNDLTFLPELTVLLKSLIKDGTQVVFFPFCQSTISNFENDLTIAHALQGEIHDPNFIVIDKGVTPREMKGLVAEMDILIAMRLHAMIFAVSTATPLIGISYSQKTTSFLKEHNQDILDARNLSVKDIERLLA